MSLESVEARMAAFNITNHKMIIAEQKIQS